MIFFFIGNFYIYNPNYTILLISIIISFILGIVIFFLFFFMAIQNPDIEKTSAYECGFEPFEDARNKLDVRFYIIAILFIIFDIEIIYLFQWSISLYALGFQSFWAMIFFISLLTLGFLYEILKQALNWQQMFLNKFNYKKIPYRYYKSLRFLYKILW